MQYFKINVLKYLFEIFNTRLKISNELYIKNRIIFLSIDLYIKL
jgi:hypothetical protein